MSVFWVVTTLETFCHTVKLQCQYDLRNEFSLKYYGSDKMKPPSSCQTKEAMIIHAKSERFLFHELEVERDGDPEVNWFAVLDRRSKRQLFQMLYDCVFEQNMV